MTKTQVANYLKFCQCEKNDPVIEYEKDETAEKTLQEFQEALEMAKAKRNLEKALKKRKRATNG